MLNFFVRGGPIMYPLLLCSLIAVAIIVERIIFWLNTERGRDTLLISDMLQMAAKNQYDKAAQRARGVPQTARSKADRKISI